jgi:SRSO17 transposase
MSAVDLDALDEQFTAFHARFAHHFYRREYRERSAHYLRALLSPVTRKNGWQLAEAMGEADPNGAQRLLFGARWDADAVITELQRFVMEQFGDPVAGVLVIDESGFLKKGTHSVGVARQYSGTAGKVENCQIGVFLTYAAARGAAFLDRRLYLPEDWAADADRRAAAHVPETVSFQTKPHLAQAMLAQAFEHGVQAGWVTGDSIYGSDGRLRRWLARRRQPFVLGVRSSERVWLIGADGSRRQRTVAQAAAEVTPGAWQRHSAGDGTKGPRWYDWAWLPIAGVRQDDWTHWLLVRRSLSDPAEVAFYLVGGPASVTCAQTVRVAGQRWTIESCLEEAKGETGLDEYEVRHWHSWHRHITLAMLAHAFLASSRQAANAALTGSAGGGGVGAAVAARGPSAAGSHVAARASIGSADVVTLAETASGACQTSALPTAGCRWTTPFTYLRAGLKRG